jgi:putative hydrolase of the HAD superfamily
LTTGWQKMGAGAMARISVVGFDADDTLWHNETFYRLTQEHFTALLRDYTARDHLEARLLEAERRNLGHYGYGIKGFTLSMIETAIEVTEGRVPAGVIAEILDVGREMLRHPVDLLPHARDAVAACALRGPVVLITKGDLLDQERKLAHSGLGDLFTGVEIVSEKTPEVYARAFARHGAGPERAMMVGNSMKSDVLPAIAAGGVGVYVPHGVEWELERAPEPQGHQRYHRLPDLGGVPDLLDQLREV